MSRLQIQRIASSVGLILLLGAIGEAEAEPWTTPRAIISLSPSVTEILYGVGAFDRVVAVSSYCDYPPQVGDLPRVGGWQNTNLERVASLRPDLVIMTDAQAPFVKNHLDALGVSSLVVGSQSLDDIFSSITEIGRAVGKTAEGRRLADRVRADLDEVRRRTAGLLRPRVLCVVDRLPGTLRDLYVATKGSFFPELIEIAGGEPLMPPASHNYVKITTEAVVSLNPDVILDMVQAVTTPVTLLAAETKLAEDPRGVWRELANVRAVSEGQIYPLQDTLLIHPSQFVGKTARRIAEFLHPEAFED
jgi:iron complex transport system substrate-binding protein